MQYVRNCWYVAGWSGGFGSEFKTATILEDNIVFYRKSSGELVALEDRCPHRLLPLSLGRIIDDNVQCGYHGMTFDSGGNCVRVPGQDNLPNRARVHSYPVHEAHNVVWIWMGDPERARVDDVFDLPQLSQDGWEAHQGDALHIASNYLNVADNLCDPAHVSFVHPTTLGNAASEDVPVETKKEGETIVTSRWIRNAPPIGFFQKFGNFKGHVDRWHYYYLHAPNIAVIDFGSADIDAELAEDRRSQGVQIYALHFLTPVDATHTIDWWMHVRNSALDDGDAGEIMNKMFRTAFDEDKEILEAIQKEELKHDNQNGVGLAIDLGPKLYRKLVDEMIANEQNV